MKLPCQDLRSLINTVYPEIHVVGTCDDKYLSERTILSSRNEDVEYINQEILEMFPGDTRTYISADSVVIEKDADNNNVYPTEFLNSLNFSGIPLAKLNLKVGFPIMLIRNLAPAEGLCNGSRLVITRMTDRVIEARILCGDHAGKLAFIPRITLTPSTSELPFVLKRRQFPIRVAFAMTINKSQGQSVKHIGLDLRTPVFSHGQLYVALSRSTSPRSIKVLFPQNSIDTKTTNIIYPEVLLEA